MRNKFKENIRKKNLSKSKSHKKSLSMKLGKLSCNRTLRNNIKVRNFSKRIISQSSSRLYNVWRKIGHLGKK